MYFSRLSITNFGPFELAHVEFKPGGVNVILGGNGTGKTQLVGAIIAAIAGKPAIRVDNAGSGPSSVEVVISEDQRQEVLRLSVFRDAGAEIVIRRSSDGADDSVEEQGELALRLRSAWSNSEGPRLLLNADDFRDVADSVDVGALEKLLPEELRQRRQWRLLRGALDGRSASGGQRIMATLLSEVIRRMRSSERLPLIIDDLLPYIADEYLEYCDWALQALALNSQVILLANDKVGPFHDRVVALLSREHAASRSLANYNGYVTQQRPRLRARRSSKWRLGAKFPHQETRVCELKEVRGGNPVSAIANVADEYVVAFLNSRRADEGSIFWGVRDEDLTITGVRLSPQDCARLRRVVTDKLHQIDPPLALSTYQIDLHPVSDGSADVPDLYLVEVRVPGTHRAVLFSTGGGEVFLKTDAGKKRLSPLAIQHELADRLGIVLTL